MPPWRRPFAITKYAIKLEQIKIIQFCLKICNPWTLLHTYRLGLMCRWGGVSYPKWHFYVFDPKKCSCDPPIKKFPIFALDLIRPYLDWALGGFLTSLPIYDPFKFDLKWRPKCKIELKCQFAIEPQKNLKCTLRCSDMSSTNHQLTLNPYHWPFMV